MEVCLTIVQDRFSVILFSMNRDILSLFREHNASLCDVYYWQIRFVLKRFNDEFLLHINHSSTKSGTDPWGPGC